MKTVNSNAANTSFSIHPKTNLGKIVLIVHDMEKELGFYTQVLGFRIHWRDHERIGLGAGKTDILILVENKSAKRYESVTGLYHFAIVYPNQKELARVIARLFSLQVRNSPTDHINTKTTYLNDPEGNGIELYAESPEDGTFMIEGDDFITRRTDGSLSSGREPLDLNALFSRLSETDILDLPLPAETRLGHVHLHVRDVPEAVDFYHGLLGFDVMGLSSTFQAAFVSAGGYHHHLGLNAWKGNGAPPPPMNSTGMKYFTIQLPDENSMAEVLARITESGVPMNKLEDGYLLVDPSENGIMITSQ